MRTKKEITLQVNGLINMKERLPINNNNDTKNADIINAQISVLMSGLKDLSCMSLEIDRTRIEIHNAILEAQEWLKKSDEINLFEVNEQ